MIGKFVLGFTADFPLLCHPFSREAHAVSNAEIFVLCQDQRVERRTTAAHGNQAHGFSTAGDYDLGFAHTNAVSGHLNGGETRCAKTVDGDAAHGMGKAAEGHGDAGHVHALLALGEGASDDGIFNRLGVQ